MGGPLRQRRVTLGGYVGDNGYRYLYLGKTRDGRAHWVLEHRFLMERHLGRALPRSEHVHHINHDRLDNRLENLQLIAQGEHTRHHHHPDRVAAAHATFEKRYGHEGRLSSLGERAEAYRLHHQEGLPLKQVAEVLGRKYLRVWKWVRAEEEARG